MVVADGGDTLRSAAPAARVTADLSLWTACRRGGAEDRRPGYARSVAVEAFDPLPASPIVVPQARGHSDMSTVTRAHLARAVAEETGLLQRDAAALVEAAIEAIAERLEAGEAVKISSFGSFRLRDKHRRMGRNPRTLEAAPITPRRVVIFRASGVLKAKIDEAMSSGGDGK